MHLELLPKILELPQVIPSLLKIKILNEKGVKTSNKEGVKTPHVVYNASFI